TREARTIITQYRWSDSLSLWPYSRRTRDLYQSHPSAEEGTEQQQGTPLLPFLSSKTRAASCSWRAVVGQQRQEPQWLMISCGSCSLSLLHRVRGGYA